MKATSLFGGVQVFRIIVSIIQYKIIAILLGPLGMGITGLLTSTTNLIASLTNFGLGTSAVKNIAVAFESGSASRLSVIVTVFKRWIWVTGLLGSIIVIIFSPFLSKMTFGNYDYTLAFIWISITLVFVQLSTSQLSILQGMRKLQSLAKANLAGSGLSLIFSVPLYYIYKIDAIVPTIIITSLVSLGVSWYYSKNIVFEAVNVSKARTIAEGKSMLLMGFMISLSNLITLGASYIIRIFISNTGGVEHVGLFTAGFAIVNGYAGMILNAMSADYYPRLSAVSNNNDLCRRTINQQAEIAILIIGPLIAFFLVFMKQIIQLMYSAQFLQVNLMLLYASVGLLFKATSWSIAFIFLAKSSSRLYFWNELLANIYVLGLNILGYNLLGLTGLGLAFMVGYFLYMIQVYYVAKIKFHFSFENEFIKIFLTQLIIVLSVLILVKYSTWPANYLIGSILIFLALWISIKQLNKRLNLISIFNSLTSRF